MDDYLTEQDQWELIKRWLKENGPWIIGGIGLALDVAFRSLEKVRAVRWGFRET